ncbi:hypothetical protein KEJ49_07950 [Candidatus Bathyarchaeota archaeon]|nr:hypothetical protein [Candidatus Bathyarchaeota archaeon]
MMIKGVFPEEESNRVFESLIGVLESKYPGMYIVIAGERIISANNSLEEDLKMGRKSITAELY